MKDTIEQAIADCEAQGAPLQNIHRVVSADGTFMWSTVVKRNGALYGSAGLGHSVLEAIRAALGIATANLP